MRLIDLSGVFEPGMWRYDASFPAFAMERALDIEETGFSVQRITLSTHMGTHVDAPGHLVADGPLIDAIPLDRFVGPAAILRMAPVGPFDIVGADRLAAAGSALRHGDIAVVETGWSSRVGEPDYVNACPSLSVDAARWLVDQGVKCLAWDAPMTMDPRIEFTAEATMAHADTISDYVLMAAGIPLIAPVFNLSEIRADRFWFSGFPLNIKGADGSPARCVAMEGVIDV